MTTFLASVPSAVVEWFLVVAALCGIAALLGARLLDDDGPPDEEHHD